MNRYIESLKSFLAEQSPCYSYDDADSLLEVLYYCYASTNPVDNAVIHFQFKELNDVLCRLTRKEIDSVFFFNLRPMYFSRTTGISRRHPCRHAPVLGA